MSIPFFREPNQVLVPNIPRSTVVVTQPVAFTPPPPVSEWAWANQDLATAEDVPGGIKITAPKSEANAFVVLVGGDLPPAPYTITAAFNVAISTGDGYGIGLTLYDPDSGKLKVYELYYELGLGLSLLLEEFVGYYNDFTSYNSGPTNDSNAPIEHTSVIWLKLSDDGANINFSLSYDGLNYCLFSSNPNSEFISTASQHGLALVGTFEFIAPLNTYDTIVPLVTTLLSYQVTTP